MLLQRGTSQGLFPKDTVRLCGAKPQQETVFLHRQNYAARHTILRACGTSTQDILFASAALIQPYCRAKVLVKLIQKKMYPYRQLKVSLHTASKLHRACQGLMNVPHIFLLRQEWLAQRWGL